MNELKKKNKYKFIEALDNYIETKTEIHFLEGKHKQATNNV